MLKDPVRTMQSTHTLSCKNQVNTVSGNTVMTICFEVHTECINTLCRHNVEVHHHHKHQGLDPLICSVSKVRTALSVSSAFQLFSFLVVCSSMISKGFGFVAFFASVETSSVCIHLSCLVCL